MAARTAGVWSDAARSMDVTGMLGFDAAALRIASVPSRSISAMSPAGSDGWAAARRRAYPTPFATIDASSSADDVLDNAPTSSLIGLVATARRSPAGSPTPSSSLRAATTVAE